MDKKKKNIELKIYELLGVKLFKKGTFVLRDNLFVLFTLRKTKEERKHYLYNTASNYNLGKVNSLEDIKKFKKQLYINASIHTFGLYFCIPGLLKVINGTGSVLNTIITFILIGINGYCIMLQRYNCIRINQLIKKMTPRYEKQKDTIKEDLKKEDSLFCEHTYKIVGKKDKEMGITFEKLIEKATLTELKEYLEYFKYINQRLQEIDYYSSKEPANIKIPIKKHKSLKLELKPNQNHKEMIN